MAAQHRYRPNSLARSRVAVLGSLFAFQISWVVQSTAAALPLDNLHPWLVPRTTETTINGLTAIPDSAYTGLVMLIEFSSDKYARASPKIDDPANADTNVVTLPDCLTGGDMTSSDHFFELSPWMSSTDSNAQDKDTRRYCQMFSLASVTDVPGIFNIKLNPGGLSNVLVGTPDATNFKPRAATPLDNNAFQQYQIFCDRTSLDIECQAYLGTKCVISTVGAPTNQVWQGAGKNADMVSAAGDAANTAQYFNIIKMNTDGLGITKSAGCTE